MTAIVTRIFAATYVVIAALFLLVGVSLVWMAASELWQTMTADPSVSLRERFDSALECVGRLTVAIASLELGQTVLEEEVLRAAHVSAPTRVRRFLSRFLIVVVVALAVECLVATFQVSHMDPTLLPYAAWIGFAAAALLLAWGIFLRQNKSVEQLEPEAMDDAKREDAKVDAAKGEHDEAPPPRP